MNRWIRRGLTLAAIFAIGAGIGDAMLCTNPDPPTLPVELYVDGVDRVTCDDMGGRLDSRGRCHDVDY